jgi:hypothetical protein
MDRFLFAHNPLKPAGPTGLQGYIVDTVKGVWIAVGFVFFEKGWFNKPVVGPTYVEYPYWEHHLSIAKSSGDPNEDLHSMQRASRWYDSWLQQQCVEVDVKVSLPTIPKTHEPGTDTEAIRQPAD